MLINFAQVLRSLPGGSVRISQLANQARPPADHLYAAILPERQEAGWDVKAANMLIRTTMAGLVGMDSVYPPGGAAEGSSFAERTAKIALHVPLTEEQLRAIDDMLATIAGGRDGAKSKEALAQEALNFFDKVIVAGLLDRSEWLRARALNFGLINWTYNQKVLSVNYGIPAANLLTNRTGTAAYGSTASAFWSDVRTLQRLLGDVTAFIIGPDLAADVINNPVNNIQVVANSLSEMTVQRFVSIAGAAAAPSTDARDRVRLIKYGAEAEIFDLANPGKTVKVLFHPRTHLLAIGSNTFKGYRPGQGSTPDPQNGVELGFHKIGPTMEGGTLGRWGELFTPEREPWALHARGASNELPVILAPEKIARASSDVQP